MQRFFLFISITWGFVLLLDACKPPTEVIEINLDKNPNFATSSDSCGDLFVQSIRLLEKGTKKALVEYTLLNNGKGAISLNGKTNQKEDNVSVQVFFSGDDKYNRGDLLVDGFFVEDALPEKNGVLQPGAIFTGQIEINLKRKTSFHLHLIFHVDPVQLFKECDETNNYTTIAF